MEALRQSYADLGFQNVKSCLQSGNVVFQAQETTHAVLADQIHEAIQDTFGFEVSILIRELTYFQRIVATSPYRNEADIQLLHATCFNSKPAAERLAESAAVPEGIVDVFTLGPMKHFCTCQAAT